MFKSSASGVNDFTVIIWQYAMGASQDDLLKVVTLYSHQHQQNFCCSMNVVKCIQSLLEDSYRSIDRLGEFSPASMGRFNPVLEEESNMQSAQYRKIVYDFVVLRLVQRFINNSKLDFYKPFCLLVLLGFAALVFFDHKDVSLPVTAKKERAVSLSLVALLSISGAVVLICQKIFKLKVDWLLLEKMINCINSDNIAKTKLLTCCQLKNIDAIGIMVNKELQDHIDRSRLFIDDQLKANDDASYYLF